MSTNENETKTETVEDEWMIRPCEVYQEEYSDCRAIRSRLHQYFVFGKTVDCTQWKRDYDNCNRWVDDKNVKAAKELIASEKQRRLDRMKAHYGNDVWEKRKEPPKDWNKPLPEHMQKEYESTYLNIKRMEMAGEIEPTIDSKCSIM